MTENTSPDQLYTIFGLLTVYVLVLAIWSYYFFNYKYKST